MVRVTENRLEPPTNGRGLFSYLFDQVKYRFRFSVFIFSVQYYDCGGNCKDIII